MIDLLYVSFNRRRYTVETFEALIANTNWEQVARLYVHDDGSTDGTAEYLAERCWEINRDGVNAAGLVPVTFHNERLGGPVAAMNWYLGQHEAADPEVCDSCGGAGVLDRETDEGEAYSVECPPCRSTGLARPELWAKIDNDMIVCPGWLGELSHQMLLHPELDLIGMEPRFGPPVPAGTTFIIGGRDVEEARFIGGKGLIRHRAFEQCRPRPRSRRAGEPAYFGFSEWQTIHTHVKKAWIKPDLPVFGLDQLPHEPWRTIASEYERLGWQRPWPLYDALQPGYWNWWTPVGEEVTA